MVAAVDVQNRVAIAELQLPAAVRDGSHEPLSSPTTSSLRDGSVYDKLNGLKGASMPP